MLTQSSAVAQSMHLKLITISIRINRIPVHRYANLHSRLRLDAPQPCPASTVQVLGTIATAQTNAATTIPATLLIAAFVAAAALRVTQRIHCLDGRHRSHVLAANTPATKDERLDAEVFPCWVTVEYNSSASKAVQHNIEPSVGGDHGTCHTEVCERDLNAGHGSKTTCCKRDCAEGVNGRVQDHQWQGGVWLGRWVGGARVGG